MSRFCTLVSSSKGNSAYLSGGGTDVLIDAGASCRMICGFLAEIGAAADRIQAIFITHEHSDHIRGLRTLLGRFRIPVYASPGTLEEIAAKGCIPAGSTLVELHGTMSVGALQVTAFDLPHDAADPVGLRFTMPDERVVGVATDLGHVTDTVRQNLTGCDLVLLESNYDPGMLISGSYPYILKRRIRGEQGHLSNDDCASEALRLAKTGTTRFVLGHLSENNNLPSLAQISVQAALEQVGMTERLDYMLSVAPARRPQPMIVF